MAMKIQYCSVCWALLVMSMLLIILEGASAAGRTAPTPPAEIGTAGFFGTPPSKTACVGLNKNQGDLIGSADIRVFQRGDTCGKKFEVTCIGGEDATKPNPCNKNKKKVVIKIVDTCEPDEKNPCPTLLLSRKAFSSIANPAAGRAAISFKQSVFCLLLFLLLSPFLGFHKQTITTRRKEGSSYIIIS
ncbi:EG45-like domain containing protein [Linum grandiflorum]